MFWADLCVVTELLWLMNHRRHILYPNLFFCSKVDTKNSLIDTKNSLFDTKNSLFFR